MIRRKSKFMVLLLDDLVNDINSLRSKHIHTREQETMNSPVLIGNITWYTQLGTVPEEYQIDEEWQLTYLKDLGMHYPLAEGSRT